MNNKLIKELTSRKLPSKVRNRIRNSSSRVNYTELRELLNDTHLWACVQSRKGSLSKYQFQIESNRSSTELYDKFIANFDYSSLIDSVINSILFGFQPIELVWAMFDGIALPSKIELLFQEEIGINSDDNYFIYDGLNKIDMQQYKHLILSNANNMIANDGLLFKCNNHIKYKKASTKYWVMLNEKYGMPMLIGKYERGISYEEVTKLADSLIDMVHDSVLVAPKDVELQLIEPNKNGSAKVYQDMIDYCNKEISKVILSQTLTTEAESGTYATGKVHQETKVDVIKSDLMIVNKYLSMIFTWVLEVNSSLTDFNLKAVEGN
jgi:phage gp29-like protein